MNSSESDAAAPTVADETSAVVDDARVISKTLPATGTPVGTARLRGQIDHALDVTRGYVIKQPMQAVLVATVGGAVLSALAIAWMRDDGTDSTDR